MKVACLLSILYLINSCSSSVSSNLYFSEKEFEYSLVDSICYIESNFNFENERKSNVIGDSIFLFDRNKDFHRLIDFENEYLKSIVNCDNCIESIDFDLCGTTFPTGYFLYFNNSKIIRLLEITCSYQGINEFSKSENCLNNGFLNDSCQESLFDLVESFKK